MNNYNVNAIIRANAAKKHEFEMQRKDDRGHHVPFAVWMREAHGVQKVMNVPYNQRVRFYSEYQLDMIRMGFLEWDCAAMAGLPKWFNVFGR